MTTGTLQPLRHRRRPSRSATSQACPDGEVVAVDSKMNAEGLRVFASGTERTTAALPIGLPPIFAGGIVCYDAIEPEVTSTRAGARSTPRRRSRSSSDGDVLR